MRAYIILLFLFIGVFHEKAMSFSQECESALHSLFAKEVSKNEAGDFLKLQGDITLHRLAWTYLKAQKKDKDHKVQSIEKTIIELLNEKYTNANPDFVKAREAYEAQPLSRSTLADIAPYLKEALSHEFPEKDASFKLNTSDLKLLAAIAKQERAAAKNGTFDNRMLKSRNPQGMLNFIKVINSSYKLVQNQEEQDLQIELKLNGLENVMNGMQKRLSKFLNTMHIPKLCYDKDNCDPQTQMDEFFKQHDEVQKIFWESLADKLESDDTLRERMSYGDLWLQVRTGQKSAVNGKSQLVPLKKTESVHSGSFHSEPIRKPAEVTTPKTVQKPYTPNLPVVSHAYIPTSPEVIQNAGLVLEDPLAIIIKDKAGRSREDFEKMEKDFLGAMAQAILMNEKVFSYKGKLFNRITGLELTSNAAVALLRPGLQGPAHQTINSTEPRLRLLHTEALVNDRQTFIADNKLYDKNGILIYPAPAIADSLGRKLGFTINPSIYKNMDESRLVAWANALKNNLPYFRYGTHTLETLSGNDLARPFRSTPGSDAKLDKTRRRMFEHLSDSELIRNFHREKPNPDCGYYGVIDKPKAMFHIYSNEGNEVYSSEVLVAAEVSDRRTRWTQYTPTQRIPSSSTGAGIFTIRSQELGDSFNKRVFNNNILSFKDENKKDTVFAIHQVPVGLENRYSRFGTNDPQDRRISGGCANLKLSDFKAMRKWLAPACKVYVLPEEPDNKFSVVDNQLKLVSSKPVPANATNLYNYSRIDAKPAPISIKIVNQDGNTQEAREYVKALQDEKAKLMKMYKLSNAEYNDLALVAYGILGNESNFGKSKRLKVKEFSPQGLPLGQAGVIIARVYSGKDEPGNTSRGLTQIKFLPDGIFTKEYKEINKDNLINPRNAAIATMGYLGEASRTMRQIALDNKDDASKLRITRENIVDYIGYIYQGSARKLKASDPSEQATPELNFYLRGLNKNMSYIEITQKIE
jgi:hypothetical protein